MFGPSGQRAIAVNRVVSGFPGSGGPPTVVCTGAAVCTDVGPGGVAACAARRAPGDGPGARPPPQWKAGWCGHMRGGLADVTASAPVTMSTRFRHRVSVQTIHPDRVLLHSFDGAVELTDRCPPTSLICPGGRDRVTIDQLIQRHPQLPPVADCAAQRSRRRPPAERAGRAGRGHRPEVRPGTSLSTEDCAGQRAQDRAIRAQYRAERPYLHHGGGDGGGL